MKVTFPLEEGQLKYSRDGAVLHGRNGALMSSTEASIEVRVLNVAAARVDGGASTSGGGTPTFDVNVKLEEVEKRVGEAVFSFAITISTKPSIAKFDVSGVVTVNGESAALEKVLQTDPESKVPYLLKRIYQQIFLSIFLLSGLINVPHPPPDLVFSSIKSELG